MWGTRPQWRSIKRFERWLRKQSLGGGWLHEGGDQQRIEVGSVLPAAPQSPMLEGNGAGLGGAPTRGMGEAHAQGSEVEGTPTKGETHVQGGEVEGMPTTRMGETHVVDISLGQSPGVEVEQSPAARGREANADGGAAQVIGEGLEGGAGVRVRIDMGRASVSERRDAPRIGTSMGADEVGADLPGTPMRGLQGHEGSLES